MAQNHPALFDFQWFVPVITGLRLRLFAFSCHCLRFILASPCCRKRRIRTRIRFYRHSPPGINQQNTRKLTALKSFSLLPLPKDTPLSLHPSISGRSCKHTLATKGVDDGVRADKNGNAGVRAGRGGRCCRAVLWYLRSCSCTRSYVGSQGRDGGEDMCGRTMCSLRRVSDASASGKCE